MHPHLYEFTAGGLLSTPWPINSYGLLIAIGFLLAMALIRREAEREGEDAERMVDLAFYLLVAGLVGARAVFILTKLDDYLRHPLEMFMFWRGGLVWYGGFIGAALYIRVYARRTKLSYFKATDIMIPYMALAHAFGRMGCLAAGCCFGRPTDVPWGITFPAQSMAAHDQALAGLITYGALPLPVHPTQLYEAGAELAMFALLVAVRPYRRFHGQLFLIWLALYPILRIVIEAFRGDKERGVYIFSTSQYLSVAVAIAAVAVGAHLRRAHLRASRASVT